MKKIALLLSMIVVLFAACNKQQSDTEKFVGKYYGEVSPSGDLKITNSSGQTSNTIIPQSQDVTIEIKEGASKNDVIVTFKDNIRSGAIKFPETIHGTVQGNNIIVDEFNFIFDYGFIGFYDVNCIVNLILTLDDDGNLTITGTTIVNVNGTGYTVTGNLTIAGFGNINPPPPPTGGIEDFYGTYIGLATTLVDSSYISTALGTSTFTLPESLAKLLKLFDHDLITFVISEGDGPNRVKVKMVDFDLPSDLINAFYGTVNGNTLVLDEITTNINIPGIQLSTITQASGTLDNRVFTFVAKTSCEGSSELGLPGEVKIHMTTSGNAKRTLIK